MRMFPILEEPPEENAVGVGLVIAKWAYQEWLLILVLRTILGIGPKQARHVFGTGEGIDYVKLIRTLLELQKLKSSIDLSDFRRELQDIREERNVVAHGLWLKDPDTGAPRIHATSGEWKPAPDEGKVSRKIKPEAAQFDRKTADALIARINETIELTKKLFGEVKSQLSKEGDATLDTASASVEEEDTLSASVAVMVSAINTPITDGTGFKIFKV